MNKKYVVAFDQGTTSTRTIVFDQKGEIKAISQKELTQHYPKSGWVEHNATDIYKDQLETFFNVISDSGIHPEEIAAIGITNQRETTVVWSRKTGEPIYNAIVWLDKRTKDICEDLKQKGLSDYINENTGLVIDSYFSGTKLKWILENVEGAREQAENGELCFGTIDSWLIYKFTNGEKHVTDHTNASRTLLYNIKNLTWDETLLSALNIPENILPEVQKSSSDFGFVDYKGTKISILGVAGDQQAALFGQGGFKSGIAKNTYGTGCFMLLNIGKKQVVSKKGLLTTLTCSIENEPIKYALEGSVFVGGASIQWLRDKMKLIQNASETEAICKSIPPLDGIYVVPAFAGLGAPYWDANAKGSIYGMTLDTGKNELIKATVEALAYQTKDVINAMIEESGKEMTTLKVDGGASSNNYLMQFQSDILNVEVDRPKMIEVTAFGAALLAGIKAGFWTLENIELLRRVDTVFVPEMKSKIRTKKYKGWLKAIDKTRTNKVKLKEKPIRFSVLDRAKQLKKVASKNFDLIIVGGGVTGAGIALDASSRGLKVCLIEKNDFASGTSNKSTKLIHGGLRYLKQLEIGLVRESGSERAIVHKLAPHLVIPEKMLLPLIEDGTYGKMMTSIGLKVYDLLANVSGDDSRRMLDKEETLAKEPLLDEEVVLGSGYYAEYRTDDARLTIELLKKAAEFGATIINYCEMQSFVYDSNNKIESLNCKDHNTGKKINISAKNYVSATGPWVDVLRKKDNSINHKYLHLTKGVHVVFPHEKLPIKQSVYFDVEDDGRMVFAIPRGRCTYVGTTDTNYSGNLERVVATKADAEYLLNAANNTFPDINLNIEDIESNWAGLRPLIHEQDKDPSELSRKDEIFISDSGLISIAGGKLTGYRKMAHRVIDVVLKTLPEKKVKKLKKSSTEHIALVSPVLNTDEEVLIYQKELEKSLLRFEIDDKYFAWYLCSTFGKNATRIVERIDFYVNGTPIEKLIRAEVWYCIHFEMTNSLADFFIRRTGSLYFHINSITDYFDIVLKDFTNYLDWDLVRVEEEKAKMQQLLADAKTYYTEEFE